MLSVIIPTDNSERMLLPTLAALVPGATAGLVREVIVADRASRDGTADIADAAGCRLHRLDAPEGARLKAATSTARSTWLMFLRPGTVLAPSWIMDVEDFLSDVHGHGLDKTPAALLTARRQRRVERPLREIWGLVRSALSGPGEAQGLVISKQTYTSLGGHHDGAETESDLVRRIGRRNVVVLQSSSLRFSGAL